MKFLTVFLLCASYAFAHAETLPNHHTKNTTSLQKNVDGKNIPIVIKKGNNHKLTSSEDETFYLLPVFTTPSQLKKFTKLLVTVFGAQHLIELIVGPFLMTPLKLGVCELDSVKKYNLWIKGGRPKKAYDYKQRRYRRVGPPLQPSSNRFGRLVQRCLPDSDEVVAYTLHIASMYAIFRLTEYASNLLVFKNRSKSFLEKKSNYYKDLINTLMLRHAQNHNSDTNPLVLGIHAHDYQDVIRSLTRDGYQTVNKGD